MNARCSAGEVARPASRRSVATGGDERVLSAFEGQFGRPATHLVRAPGRVNLLGEHTDYNDGFVLPMAIDRSAWIAFRPRDDRRVVVRSLEFDEEHALDLGNLDRSEGCWFEYVKGTAWALAEAGLELRGWEGVLSGEVPLGAGLSSSAALEIAVARAFTAAADIPWEPVTAARWAQRAENGWVGVQCGIMDPLIIAAGREGHALLIDCRDLRAVPHPIPSGVAVAVLDTSTRRDLTESVYNEQRARCEETARRLGGRSLRDVELSDLDRGWSKLPDGYGRLARHVLTENARTLAAADALKAGDAVRLGALMVESHRSLRDDFRVSSEALDAMVLAACETRGCYGARMTGAGFAGCAVALVESASCHDFAIAVERAYRQKTGLDPAVYVCHPSAGASLRRVS